MRSAGVTAVAVAGLLASSAVPAAGEGEWSREQVPLKPGTVSILSTVSSGDGETWAFGGWKDPSGDPGGYNTLAYQRTSHGWREVPIPNVGNPDASAVIAKDDAWVAGAEVTCTNSAAAHWDGAKWTEVPLAPLPAEWDRCIRDMRAFASDDIWAAGTVTQYGPDAGERGTVEHWDGKAWKEVPLPDMPDQVLLGGIGGTGSDDIWVFGTALSSQPMVALHWDGHAWTQVHLPTYTGPGYYGDVVALARDDVWATFVGRDGGSKPKLLHWDGKRWSFVEAPAVNGDLTRLVRAGGQLWLVGSGESVLRYDGHSWRRVPRPSGGNIIDGAALDDGSLLGVGYQGGIGEQQPFAARYGG